MRGPPDNFGNSVFGLTEEVEELGILRKLVQSLERLVSLVGPDRSPASATGYWLLLLQERSRSRVEKVKERNLAGKKDRSRGEQD